MHGPSPSEAYCASVLGPREGEEFLAVGEKVALRLNPRYHDDRLAGKAESLPDLLSVKDGVFRLREVKFRLDDKTVRKAVAQLASGAALLDAPVDRLEIAVPLGPRKLKPSEAAFLGASLDGGRHELRLDGGPVEIRRVAVGVVIF